MSSSAQLPDNASEFSEKVSLNDGYSESSKMPVESVIENFFEPITKAIGAWVKGFADSDQIPGCAPLVNFTVEQIVDVFGKCPFDPKFLGVYLAKVVSILQKSRFPWYAISSPFN